jgi:hypothetical protein
MKLSEQPFCISGHLQIDQENPDGTWINVFSGRNKIMDYGRSMLPQLLAGIGGLKISKFYYGEGRPLGSDHSETTTETAWPANAVSAEFTNPYPSLQFPRFVNVADPNASLQNIDSLEPDLYNKLEMSDGSTLMEYDTDRMPEYLRFRTRLHKKLQFNTAYGNPETVISSTFYSYTLTASGDVPTYNNAIDIIQNAESKDLAATYPKGSYCWAVRFEALMDRSNRAYINGQDRPSFTFNELAMVFEPFYNSSSDRLHGILAMRYIPDITKIDGLALRIRWSIIC